MSKFARHGIEYDLPDQPQVTGWEFQAYRRVHFKEHYYCIDIVMQWDLHENTNGCYWIATRVVVKRVKKPIVDGWEFKEDKSRLPKATEYYYCPANKRIECANSDFSFVKYWIATRIKSIYINALSFVNDYTTDLRLKTKQRKIVRREIQKGTHFRYVITPDGARSLDRLSRRFDFLHLFEYENGTLLRTPTAWWCPAWSNYMPYPTIKDIESGEVVIRHAVSALFWEDE